MKNPEPFEQEDLIVPGIYPFPCYYVDPAYAREVVTPPYDAFTPKERAAFAQANPGNFLNVMRSPEEFDPAESMTQDRLLEHNRTGLESLLKSGRFLPCPQPSLYLYRLISGEHEQTGLVCEVGVDEYRAGQSIKVHEQTRKEKEDQLLAYLEAVGVSSSPVCCTYRHQPELDSLIQKHKDSHDPLLDFSSWDGVRHTVWRIGEPGTIARIGSLFRSIRATYLTDGHHRAAVALRYAQQQRKAAPPGGVSGKEPFNFLLVAFFPENQLKILPYNRCIKGLNGLSRAEFLRKLEEHFTVRELGPQETASCQPDRPGSFACLLQDTWYALQLRPEVRLPADPVKELDVSILHNLILEPILGIQEARTDPRICYVSGITGTKGLENSCREGFDVAFACFRTSVEQLIAVADAGQVMPPKSTWFEPKVRSGLFLRLRNRDDLLA